MKFLNIYCVVVIESCLEWWHEFGSETVVTPWTMTFNMVANPPKSDVGQMTRTMCDTSKGDLQLFFTS